MNFSKEKGGLELLTEELKQSETMLKQRILVAVIGVPLMLFFLFLSHFTFYLLITAIVLIGLDEFYSLVRFRGMNPNILFGMFSGILLCTGAYVGGGVGLATALLTTIFLSLFWEVFTPKTFTVSDFGITIYADLYVAFLLSHLILIRGIEKYGAVLALITLITVWISDSAAYGYGIWKGKKKFLPSISPNKTWEGTLAGLISSALISGLLYFLLVKPFHSLKGILWGFLVGFILGIAAPVGDLAESRLKREMKVKDTGFILPGHGGILDRFDSLLFAAPAAYYILKLIIG